MAKANPAKIKDEAAKHLRRGKLDKALEAYQQLEKVAKNDLKVPQKIAEIMLKMGDKDKAVAKYKEAAQAYYERGFLIQAIAIYKVVLDIKPDDREIKEALTKLSEERTGGGAPIAGIKPSAPAKSEKPRAKKEPEPVEEPEPEEPVEEPDQPIGLGSDEEEPAIALDQEAEPEDLGLSPDDDEEAVPVGDDEEAMDLEESAPAPEEGGEEIELAADEEIELAEDEEPADQAALIVPVEEEEELPARGPEHTPLFSDLAPGEFDRVFELLSSQVVEPDTVIIKEGEPGDSLYIIARGQVKVAKKDDGGERELAVLGPSDFFGEMGYFHGTRNASVIAVKRCLLLEMTKKDLDQVVAEFPRVKEVLLKFYRERVLDTLLAESPLFMKLSASERRHFGEKFKHRELEPGQIIVNEGDPGDSMFLLKSGEVIVQGEHPVKKEKVVLAELKGGDFFGEVSLIKNKPRTATVIAKSETEILELSRRDFEKISSAHPEIGAALEKTIEQRVEQTIKKMIAAMES